jgi:hypothetical protein
MGTVPIGSGTDHELPQQLPKQIGIWDGQKYQWNNAGRQKPNPVQLFRNFGGICPELGQPMHLEPFHGELWRKFVLVLRCEHIRL